MKPHPKPDLRVKVLFMVEQEQTPPWRWIGNIPPALMLDREYPSRRVRSAVDRRGLLQGPS